MPSKQPEQESFPNVKRKTPCSACAKLKSCTWISEVDQEDGCLAFVPNLEAKTDTKDTVKL